MLIVVLLLTAVILIVAFKWLAEASKNEAALAELPEEPQPADWSAPTADGVVSTNCAGPRKPARSSFNPWKFFFIGIAVLAVALIVWGWLSGPP